MGRQSDKAVTTL